MFIKVLLITVVFLALAVAGFAIKMFFVKNGEFKKQCSSVDPYTGKNLGCSCEGAPGDGRCRKEDEKHSHHHHKPSPVVAQFKELEIN
ncbi:MAG: hypothetical protein K9G61_04760 [Bacteroidales bacterium]|nr:hypothetical protein [Bacteroidales bacterium]